MNIRISLSLTVPDGTDIQALAEAYFDMACEDPNDILANGGTVDHYEVDNLR